jgi:hypothetical protein
VYLFALATLLLQPWHGKDLPTASTAAAKYRLTIRDAAGTTIHLRTANVARGWIAAFCDSRVCSPGRVTETLPASGKIVLQFELIREDDGAPRTSGATILSDDGKPVRIAGAGVR